MKLILLLTAIATYLLSAMFPSLWLEWVLSILCLLIVTGLIGCVPTRVRIISIAFLTAGVIMLAVDGEPWNRYVFGFGSMMNVLSLFALITLITIPIELGNYAIRVQAIIQSRVKHSGVLYSITSILSYIMSSFMNLAALPMMYQTIRPSLGVYPIAKLDRFISRSITHGYSMPILWTPVAPIVGIVVEMTGASWSSILPIVIPFSVLGLVLDAVMGLAIANRRQKQLSESAREEASAAREDATALNRLHLSGPVKASHPIQIFIAVLLFNLVILLLEQATHISFLLGVILVIIPFAYIWSLLLGRGRAFALQGCKRLPEHLMKMKEQFIVFLSAGFMITAIQTTGAGALINDWVLGVKDSVGEEIFLLGIPLIPLMLAFIGLHPAVGLFLVADSLNPAALGISVEVLAIAMLTGSAAAFMMGPYNATAGMMANLTGQSTYQITKWNVPFTAAYLLMTMVLLFVLSQHS